MAAQTTFTANPQPVDWTKVFKTGKVFRVGVVNQTNAEATCYVRLNDGARPNPHVSNWTQFLDVPAQDGQFDEIRFNNADTTSGRIRVEITLEDPPGNAPADLSKEFRSLNEVQN